MPSLPWAQSSQIYTGKPAILIIIALFLVYFFKEILLKQLSSKSTIFYAVLFPGVILHELSHIAGCAITFTKISSFKLFSKTGGFVKHEAPKLPVLGILIISIAPLASGLAVVYFILIKKFADFNLSGLNSANKVFATLFFFYLIITVVLTMLPSYEDFQNAFISYFILAISLIIFQEKLASYLSPILLTLIFCLGALIVVSFILYALKHTH
ncbi:MAG: hypothetical protein OEV37_03285 [Candidatus Berkelbacteria bacterium]|nr:hypothetical protein [Candidatus Berkelbacteria bacterium]